MDRALGHLFLASAAVFFGAPWLALPAGCDTGPHPDAPPRDAAIDIAPLDAGAWADPDRTPAMHPSTRALLGELARASMDAGTQPQESDCEAPSPDDSRKTPAVGCNK